MSEQSANTINLKNNILRFTFQAKDKLTGKKKDATEAVLSLNASLTAVRKTIEQQQELLVEACNALDSIEQMLDKGDVEGALKILRNNYVGD